THGASVSSSGKLYNAVQYGITDAVLIDYDEVERLGVEHKPKMIVAGFSAYSQVLDIARFRAIADKVGAYLFVDMAHVAGREDSPSNSYNPLQQVKFSDGTTWDVEAIKARLYTGSAHDDLLIGTVGIETMLGGAGNDTVYGRAGNDLISGGDGNDVL
ncbi:hypothetical protein ACWKWZ_28000, partial [Metapseudomonas otitidis]